MQEPDILLSLGTGQHQTAVVEKLRAAAPGPPQSDAGSSLHISSHEVRNMVRKWRLGRGGDIFEAEQDWQAFKAAAGDRLHGKGLIRLNPDLGKEPPAQDRKDQLRTLQACVRQQLQELHRRKAVDHVAQRLVATAFYLDVRSQSTDEKGASVVIGSIACRFEDGTAELRAFGRVLDHRARDGFEPYFSIRPSPDSTHVHSRVTLTNEKITRMVNDAVFEQPNVLLRLEDIRQAFSVNLFLSARDALEPGGFPISGFPRGIVRHSSSRAHPRSAAPGTEDWPGGNGRESSTIFESVFSRHPAFSRRSTISRRSNGTRSSLTNSTTSRIQPWDGREDPRAHHVNQRPSVDSVTSGDDAHILGKRPAKCSYRRTSRIGLEVDTLARAVSFPTIHPLDAENAYSFNESHPDQLRFASVVDGREWDDTVVPRPLQPRHDHFGGGQLEARPSEDSLGSSDGTVFEEDDPFYLELVGKQSEVAPGTGHRVGVRDFDDTETLNSLHRLYT